MTPVRSVPLEKGEWYDQEVPKEAIFLHHTAGGHRPDWTVQWWNRDRQGSGARRRVGTAYVIGGRSTSGGDDEWDGVVIQCFPEGHWSNHLGVKPKVLERKSIGIELCNYGWVDLSHDGRFYSYVKKPVPADQVAELDRPFRGHRFYHRYTDAQLDALAELLPALAGRHGIDLRAGLREEIDREGLRMPDGLGVRERQRWLNAHGFVGKNGKPLVEDGIHGPQTAWAEATLGRSAFEYDPRAYAGTAGLWTHTNVRTDKSDCSPQGPLVDLIRSL